MTTYIPPSMDSRYIEDESEFYIVTQVKTKNVVRNGGFENGFDYWTLTNPTYLVEGKYGGHAATVTSTASIYGGIESPTDGKQASYVRTYASFDAKAAAGSTTTVTLIVENSYLGTQVATRTYTVYPDRWTRYTLDFTPTAATCQFRFTAAGTAYVDNVHAAKERTDLHVPMPHALALRIFDYSDQKAPFISANGLTVRLSPLSDYGFKMSGVVGLGYENPQHNTIQATSGEERLLSTVPVSKDFSITGTISDASSANIDRRKATLVAAIASARQSPVILAHKRRNCKVDIGELGFIQCAYTGGLGIQRTNNHIQDISLDFRQLDPNIYYLPKSLNADTVTALRKPTDPNEAATFPRQRWTYRYKGQPYRSCRNTGSSTLVSQYDGAVEDSEGNLWIWGQAADDMAFEDGLSAPSTANKYIVRLYRESGTRSYQSVTRLSNTHIAGAVPLKNGDMLIYGGFSSVYASNPGLAIWNSRTNALTGVPTITSASASIIFTKMRIVGNRIWFIVNDTFDVSGVSIGTTTQCQRSVFYTDDYFQTVTRFAVETVYTPALDIETDDAGNFYVRSIIQPASDEWTFLYKLEVDSTGTITSSVIYSETEDSTHVLPSYVFGTLIKRKSGVALPYAYTYALPGTTTTYHLLEIRDRQNQSVQTDPGGAFYNWRGYTDEARDSRAVLTTDSTGSWAYNSDLLYRSYRLSTAVEFDSARKILPAHARVLYKSANWEFGKEIYVSPYRAVPAQTTVTNPAASRVYPHIRFIGGGFTTYLGRIVNETNGSSLSFSGRLRGGEEFLFDPLNPVPNTEVSVLENTGPGGLFCLDPGENSIVIHANTLWHEIPSGAVSGSKCIRHLELTKFVDQSRFTGKIRAQVAASTLTVYSYATGSNYSLTAGSTTPSFTEPSGSLNVLTLTATGSDNIDGLALMYSGTYTSYDSGALYVPLIQFIVPTAAMTIEAGTI